MNPDLQPLLKKRGFWDTFTILAQTSAISECAFFKQLDTRKSYKNVYYRTKRLLLAFGFITYSLNPEDNQKWITLTPKGNAFWRVLEAL